MTDDIYRQLQEYLDSLPVGFPKTESGIELAILRKIYQPDEAKIAVLMTPIPETSRAFSQRTGIDPDEASRMLERMASKGQIFRMKKGKASSYHVIPFIPGIYEYQIENMVLLSKQSQSNKKNFDHRVENRQEDRTTFTT